MSATLQVGGCASGIGKCIVSMFTSRRGKRNGDLNPALRAMWLKSPNILSTYDHAMHALRQMWSQGVVHQDLHAKNLLYDEETEQLKIIDFGLAHMPLASQFRSLCLV